MNNNYCDPRLLVPLKEFCFKINDDWNSGYYWGPFLPYVMEKYNESKVKTFFIGRDTRAWINEEKYGSGLAYLKNLYDKNDLNQYLVANSELNPYDIEKWNNNTSAFWTFASKLYLSIITKQNYYSIKVQDYSESDMGELKNIGYGNLYAIEKKIVLKEKILEAIAGKTFITTETKKSTIIYSIRQMIFLTNINLLQKFIPQRYRSAFARSIMIGKNISKDAVLSG